MMNKMINNNKQEYIDFFTHMQKENNRIPLGGMAWDEVAWWIYNATEKDKLFTRNELADMFPDLLGYLRDN